MSIWAHVAGVIRFDGILGLTPEPDCGNTCSFEDDGPIWDRCNIPCGSEGSLQVSKWQDPTGSSLAQWTYTIFGDLRSFENFQEIINYFTRITDGQAVRNGVFTVEIGPQKRTFLHDGEGFVELVVK